MSMPSGWHWSCPCGWGTGRHASLETVERYRDGHLRKHAEDRMAEAVARLEVQRG